MTPGEFSVFAAPLPEPVLLVTTGGTVLAANPAALRMLGRRAGQVAGRALSDLVADSEARVAEYLRDCSRSAQFTLGTLTWCAENGSELECRTEGALLADSDHSGPAILLRAVPMDLARGRFLVLNEKTRELAREVSERRQAEAEAQRSRQRLEAVLDNSAAVIYLKDDQSCYAVVNRSYELLTGIARQDIVGKTDFDLFPEETARLFRAHDEAVMERGEPMEFEEVVHREDGPHTYLALKFPVPDPVTGAPGLGGISTDITERKRLDEQLRETQKLESLGVLAGGVAHDFNNLLTGIMGNASLAMELISPGSPARQALEDLVRASERAAHLTRQMLAYAGKGRFLVEHLDLSETVRDIANLVRISIPRNVQLRLNLAAGLPAVEADPGQLQQLVMNLVINGAEAIGDDKAGTVLVSTGLQHADAEYIRNNFPAGEISPGPHVVLEVHDTGSGMDEATRARIFDPFFTTKFTGRGLGLSAVLGIVRGHHGAMRVYSNPGMGSTFKVLFPVARTGAAERRQPEPPQNFRGAGTVLVVDDEEVVRRTARSMLQRFGYEVLLAENGQEALDIFSRNRAAIRLILLDLTMPVMGGEEAFRQLRLLDPDVRVLLSSGYNEVEAIRRFTAKGVAGFIQKPYTAAALASKVKALIGSGPM